MFPACRVLGLGLPCSRVALAPPLMRAAIDREGIKQPASTYNTRHHPLPSDTATAVLLPRHRSEHIPNSFFSLIDLQRTLVSCSYLPSIDIYRLRSQPHLHGHTQILPRRQDAEHPRKAEAQALHARQERYLTSPSHPIPHPTH